MIKRSRRTSTKEHKERTISFAAKQSCMASSLNSLGVTFWSFVDIPPLKASDWTGSTYGSGSKPSP